MIKSILLTLFALAWVPMGIFGYRTMTKAFKKYKNYYQTRPTQQKYKVLTRDDAHLWNKQRIIIGCFTLFPFRFILFLSFLLGCCFFALFFMIFGNRTILNKGLFLYLYIYGRFVTRLMCNIKQDFDSRNVLSPIIISNHVSWFDIFYIVTKFAPLSFVAKQEVKNWPVIGVLAVALQCIFINRDSEVARKDARQGIKNRIDQINALKKNKFPLVIFPQGTTSNGKGILTFKNGAFEHLSSLTAVCLSYKCDDFEAGMDQVTQAQHFILLMSQLASLNVKKLTFEPNIGQDSQQYEDRCRKTLAETLKIRCYETGYRDKIALQHYRKQTSERYKHQ